MGYSHIRKHRASAAPRCKPPQASPALRPLRRALAQATEPAIKASLARTIAALEARGRQ
jgi:hypothetical protein